MGTDAIALRDLVAVLRQRWKVVVATVLVTVLVGLGLSLLQSPTYVASSEVLLTPATVSSTGTAAEVTPEQLATEARAVTAQDVSQAVIDRLGLDESLDDLTDTVTVELDPDGASVLTISAGRRSAAEAADVANAYADLYLESGEQRTTDQLAAIEERVATVDREIGDLSDRLQDATIPNRNQVVSQLRTLRAQRQVLADLQANIDVGAGLSGPVGTVATPAVEPAGPSSPQPVRNVALAVVIGLLLGVGLAFLRNYFDDRVRDDGVLRSAIGDRPVLGRIPRLRTKGDGLTMIDDAQSPIGEAYRGLGVNVRFLLAAAQGAPRGASAEPGSGRPRGQVLLVASATAGEGKTSTSANLAVVAARTGLRTVLVDADLRRPRIATLYGLGSGPGLADVLAGRVPMRQAAREVGVDDLLVLPAGTLPPNPAELLASPMMREIVTDLSVESDLVIIDSPALLAVADALELVPLADLSVLVARTKVSRKRAVGSALQMIEQVGGPVPGGVLVGTESRADDYSPYHSS